MSTVKVSTTPPASNRPFLARGNLQVFGVLYMYARGGPSAPVPHKKKDLLFKGRLPHHAFVSPDPVLTQARFSFIIRKSGEKGPDVDMSVITHFHTSTISSHSFTQNSPRKRPMKPRQAGAESCPPKAAGRPPPPPPTTPRPPWRWVAEGCR